MDTFSSFAQLANSQSATFAVIQETQTLNAIADVHAEFKRLYEMSPANSPAKRRQLLNLLNQYRLLSPAEKAEFDKFLISGNGVAR